MRRDLEEIPNVDDAVVQRLRGLSARVAQPGEDVIGELIALFERDGRARLAAIRAAVTAHDPEARRRHAHALKGAAGNLGATRVAAGAQRVELHGATIDDVDMLDAVLGETVAALKERFARP